MTDSHIPQETAFLILSELAAINTRLGHLQDDVTHLSDKVERVEKSNREQIVQLRSDLVLGESKQNALIMENKKKLPGWRTIFNGSPSG